MMRSVKLLIAMVALAVMCENATAQLDILKRGVQRGVERAVERKVEEKSEEVVNKKLEKAEEQRTKGEAELEKSLERIAVGMEEIQKIQEEVDVAVAEIPEISNMPYTPSESEFAFFAMKKGAVQVFVSKDDRGKITSQTRNTVTEITGKKNAFAIHYESEMLDEKGIPTNTENPLILKYRVVIKDGVMYLDMNGMFGAIEGLEGMQVSGTGMKIPNSLSVGQSLEDSSAKGKIGFISYSVTTTEGKCQAIEDVTVAAGTFRCYKVSQKSNSSSMGIKMETNTLTWYAKGVGTVKTETYDKKGKLLSTQELISNK